ncbi:jg1000, partial [Pararge aegeria aegeria]
SGAAHNARVVEAGSDWRSLGVVGGGARHPSRAALAARLATFERWPADRAQAPRTLADAGFFYTGVDDQEHSPGRVTLVVHLDSSQVPHCLSQT